MVPPELRYTKDHEWVRLEDDIATIGITTFAADQLGDVVFVDLPAVGRTFARHATFGVVESVKAVSDLFMPVAGEVLEVNEALRERPELLNGDPFGDGWMLRIRMAEGDDGSDLLDAQAYEALTAAG